MNEPTDILHAIPQLEQEIPADHFMASNFWIPVAWGAGIALILAALALVLWLRCKKKKAIPPITPEEIALRKLRDLETNLPPLKECSLELSMVLRSFLTGKAQDPALYETHEEFSMRMDSLSGLPASCQSGIRLLLEELAAMKYKEHTQDDAAQARALIERTRTLISDIATALQQEAERAAELARVHK